MKGSRNHFIRAFSVFFTFAAFLVLLSVQAHAEEQNIAYRYYYKQLDPVQQEIYDDILTKPAETAVYTIYLNTDLSSYADAEGNLLDPINEGDTIGNVLGDSHYAIKYDLPENCSWIAGVEYLNCDLTGNTITYKLHCNEFFNAVDYLNAERMLDVIEATADQNWTAYEKAMFIVDMVANSMQYNMDYQVYDEWCLNEYLNNEFLSVVFGKATCGGYSAIFKAMADRLELPCVQVGSTGHAFVYIQMDDGKWYGADPQGTDILKGKDNFEGQSFLGNGEDMYALYNVFRNPDIVYPQIEKDDYVTEQSIPEYERVNVSALRRDIINNNEIVYTYSVNDDGTSITLTSYRGPQNGDLLVPDSVDGHIVTAIGNSAFANCSGFTGRLVIPETVTYLGSNAFAYCSGLQGKLELPDGLTYIGGCAFKDCHGLAGILELPSSLREIGKMAFAYCWGLAGDLVFPEGFSVLKTGAFLGCSNLNGRIYLPASMVEWNAAIDENVRLESIEVSAENPVLSSYDGVLYSKDGKTLLFCPRTRTGEVIVPEGVEVIGELAFAGCRRITKLVFPDSIKEFQYRSCYALMGLESPLHIPAGVKRVGQSAFQRAKVEETIVIPGDVDISDNSAFCDMVGCSRVIIGEGITELPSGTFSGSNLLEAVIPASVNSIQHGCFEYCEHLTILGNTNSYAEQYAIENNIPFSIIAASLRLNYLEYTLDVEGTLRENSVQLSVSDYLTDESVSEVRWFSADESIATVDNTGLVCAQAQGKTEIYATTPDGQSVTCMITCARQIRSVEIQKSFNPDYFVNVGESSSIYLRDETQDGLTLYDGIRWSISDPAVAMFWSNYENVARVDVYFINIGSFTLTATAPDGSSCSYTIEVRALPTETIIPTGTVKLVYGLSGYNSLIKAPQFIPSNTGIMLAACWSMDAGVAYPYSNYAIDAWGVGTTYVVFALADGTDIRYRVVSEKAVELVLPDSFACEIDENGNHFAMVQLSNERQFQAQALISEIIQESPSLTWTSSDPSVIEIDSETGEITVIRPGTADIAVEAVFPTGTIVESVSVSVLLPWRLEIISDPVSTLRAGMPDAENNTLQLRAEIVGNCEEEPVLHWRSLTRYAEVNEETGLVTGINAGPAEIQVYTETEYGEYASEVYRVNVQAPFQLNGDYIYLDMEEAPQFQLEVTSWDDCVLDCTVHWFVPEESQDVLTVDENGQVTLLRPSVEATVQAISPEGYWTECRFFGTQRAHAVICDTVYVRPNDYSSIYNVVRFEPESVNIYNLVCSRVENETVSVTEDGTILGVQEGIAEFTIEDTVSGNTTLCKVIVCDHELQWEDYVSPTCTEDGHTSGEYCLKCGYSTVETLRAGHIWIRETPTLATLTENGQTGRVICEHCGEVREEAAPILHTHTLFLPSALKTIGEEAFAGINAQQIVISEGTTSIESGAFSDCESLLIVVIPDSVTEIAVNAFGNSERVLLLCKADSTAMHYAEAMEIAYLVM